MKSLYSKDLKTLLGFELERNAKVRVAVGAYAELTEEEKALFRLAAGISQDSAGVNREHRRRPNDNTDSGNGNDKIQPLVKPLMKTLLEDYPTLLSDADIRNLLDRDLCKTKLGFELKNLALLRRTEHGRHISGHARYWARVYADRFYVCNNWWRDDHLANAKSLLRFVTELAQRNPNHPGVPALERLLVALQDYIG